MKVNVILFLKMKINNIFNLFLIYLEFISMVLIKEELI